MRNGSKLETKFYLVKRIRQNVYGNWVGYEGRKRIKDFGDCPFSSAEEKAINWKNRKENM
jgi:predicted DNA-binding WGR domain protein